MPPERRENLRAARTAVLHNLTDTVFDVLVIGGGITGAGTARDAAMRGLSVAMVEKDDFASGTSSRSSRLIHGGIRYLEHGQVHMVRESSRERAILLEIAPHLVQRLRFTWPVYRGARVPRWKLSLGLSVYDRLAGYSKLWHHEKLDARGILENEPFLNPKELTGGASYFDASTDDARLTLANVLSAREYGAEAANYVRAIKINPGKPNGVRVRDELTSIEFEIRARSVVDATGPWASEARTQKSKGTHIALDRKLVNNRDALTVLSPVDGRVMFILPSGSFTIVGTTDSWTAESPDDVHASPGEIDYLLRSARASFPEHYLSPDHVTSAWAGLRPLVASSTRGNPSAVSREHRITRDRSGTISVSGGKMTTYRSMASEICDEVQRALRSGKSPSTTADEMLAGEERASDLKDMIQEDPFLGETLIPEHQATRAEVRYAASRELAVTIGDILIRRTRVAFETADHGKVAAGIVADELSSLFTWSKNEKSDQLRRYDAEANRIFGIGPSTA
ncbi:MAG: glycerol-3-phosphate dehydrogenase/oxidase [Gemmatimonadaceae bacterium]|nr:glycerol-3-phosphate dehydrogenase/oxidase [Gemmatimonadaceae bacterium]